MQELSQWKLFPAGVTSGSTFGGQAQGGDIWFMDGSNGLLPDMSVLLSRLPSREALVNATLSTAVHTFTARAKHPFFSSSFQTDEFWSSCPEDGKAPSEMSSSPADLEVVVVYMLYVGLLLARHQNPLMHCWHVQGGRITRRMHSISSLSVVVVMALRTKINFAQKPVYSPSHILNANNITCTCKYTYTAVHVLSAGKVLM